MICLHTPFLQHKEISVDIRRPLSSKNQRHCLWRLCKEGEIACVISQDRLNSAWKLCSKPNVMLEKVKAKPQIRIDGIIKEAKHNF
jgi:hypothetical protein